MFFSRANMFGWSGQCGFEWKYWSCNSFRQRSAALCQGWKGWTTSSTFEWTASARLQLMILPPGRCNTISILFKFIFHQHLSVATSALARPIDEFRGSVQWVMVHWSHWSDGPLVPVWSWSNPNPTLSPSRPPHYLRLKQYLTCCPLSQRDRLIHGQLVFIRPSGTFRVKK